MSSTHSRPDSGTDLPAFVSRAGAGGASASPAVPVLAHLAQFTPAS